jgi:hypothetical protein
MGWASGLQAGLQLGRAFREGQERRAMEDILAAKPTEIEQGYTPQMGEQLQGIATAKDAEGNLAYQVTPQAGGGYGLSVRNAEGGYTPVEGPGIQPQRVTEFLGQRYEGGLAPERMDALRTRAMANAISDPRQRQQMLLAATAEERAAAQEGRAVTAEARAQQGFETEQELRKYQLGEAEEKAAVTGRSKQFSEWYSQNPNATFTDISAKAKELKMSPTEQFKVASDITGINETELKNNSAMLKKLTQGKGYQELLQIHKDSELVDPGSHFEAIPGKNGQISLQRVDTKTGKPIGGVAFTGTEAEVTKYLSTAANAPDTIVDFTINLESKRASIAKDLAAADNYRADAKLREAKASQDKAAKVMDDATVKKLNDLSMQISDADARGDTKAAANLFNQWTREYAIGATQMGKIVQPKQPGLAKSLTPEQSDRYKDLLKSNKWDRAKTTAEKVALLRADGIPPESVGFGGRQDVYAGDRSSESQGLTPSPAPAPAAAPAPAPAPAGLRTGGERNPYVDARGRPLMNPPPSGDAAPISRLVPAVQSAGRSVAAGLDTAAARYLSDKISRGEPLSAAEQLRAAAMGFYD